MPAPALALPVVTMPAWAPLAMTAVGLGGTYLTNKDKIDRQLERIATLGGLIPSFTGNRADTNIQWRDGTVTDANGTVVTQPSVTTPTIPIDDTPVVATAPAVEADLGNIGITPPPPEDPNKKKPWKGTPSARWHAVGELGSKVIPSEDEETPVVVESDKPVVEEVDDLSTMKKDWLAKTANSPAAKAGIDPDARWKTYLGNQAWRKDHGRSYNTNLDSYLKPSSENKRHWNVFGNQVVMGDNKPSVTDKVDEFLETVPTNGETIVTEGEGTKLIKKEDGSVIRVPVDQELPGSTTLSVDGVPVQETPQQIIEGEKKRRLEKIMSDDFLPYLK